MIIAGIDYSLRGPAICVFSCLDGNTKFTFSKCRFFFLTSTRKYANDFLGNIHGSRFMDYNCENERYDSISEWAVEQMFGVEECALEGYSMGSKGRVFNIAENTGVLKYKLWQSRIPVTITPPTTIKKFATGKGNADKFAMYEAFKKETKVDLRKEISPNKKDVGNPVSDIIDSYYICKHLHSTFAGRA